MSFLMDEWKQFPGHPLPETGERFLAKLKNGQKVVVYFGKIGRGKNDWRVDFTNEILRQSITHFMPMPPEPSDG